MDNPYCLDPRLNVLPPKFTQSKGPWQTGCEEECQGCAGGSCAEKLHVHLLGIAGVAMCALAGLLKDAGYKVTGADYAIYPPMSDILAGLGIEVYEGYQRLNCQPDLVVVGNVVSPKEKFSVLAEIAAKKIHYLSLPQTLNKLFMNKSKNLVVCGCHGKTSTTALAAKVWQEAGEKPGFLIGGASLDFLQSWQYTKSPWFIIEGDEYDTAFFNKVPKFVHYLPHLVILTSIEFDHADIYPDLDSVIEAYESLMAVMSPEGLLIANGDDPLVRKVAGLCPAPVQFYGLGDDNDWRLSNFQSRDWTSSFQLTGPGFNESLTIKRPGLYNALNAAAVAAAFSSQGGSVEKLKNALAAFKGVKRRQEYLGDFGGIMVIDDFAHHPTAVEKTLAGLKAAFPQKRILAAFEPRSNTSRRAIFQDDYAQSLALADLSYIRQTSEADKAPEGDRFDSQKLIADLKGRARLFSDGGEIAGQLALEAQAGDLILIMSNGGFDGLRAALLQKLADKYGKMQSD